MAGALGGFPDVALVVNFSIDQVDIAVVLFRLLIHQLEDTLGTCQRHDDGVNLVGNLRDGHIEAAGQHHKRHQAAQGEQLAIGHHHHHAAHNGQHRILNVAQVIIDGTHHVGKFTGGVGIGAELLVEHVKFLFAGILVVENLHHSLAVNHFLDIAIHRAQGLLLSNEILAGLARQVLGHIDNRRHGENHHEKQHPAGCNQADGHHNQRDGGGGALGNGLADHLPQGIHIAGVAGHDVAGGIGIEVAQGQPLHLGEHLVPDGLLRSLGHAHHQIVIQERTKGTHNKQDCDFGQIPRHGAKVLGAGGRI